jgi:hypothetical protein
MERRQMYRGKDEQALVVQGFDVDRGFGRFVGVDFYENQPRDIFPRVVLNLVDKGTWLDDDNVASGLRSLASFAV